MRRIIVKRHTRKLASGKTTSVKRHARLITRRSRPIFLSAHTERFQKNLQPIKRIERTGTKAPQFIYNAYLDLYKDYAYFNKEDKYTLNNRMGEFLKNNPTYIRRTENSIKEKIIDTEKNYYDIFQEYEEEEIADEVVEKTIKKVTERKKENIPINPKETKEIKSEIKKELKFEKPISKSNEYEIIFQPGSTQLLGEQRLKGRRGIDLI